MRIRSEQMESLSESMRSRYVKRMVTMLRGDFPESFSAVNPAELERAVQSTIDQAAGYGVTHESDLTFYIRLQGVLGIRFQADPQHAWIGEIFQRNDLSGTEKMDQVHDRLVFSKAGRV